MGPYGEMGSAVKTAYTYTGLMNTLTDNIPYIEDEISARKKQMRFFDETGFPDFPLGISFCILHVIIRIRI